MLCYVDSIDWSSIASGSTEIFIAMNKPQNECPVCPSTNATIDCPPSKSDPRKGLCWNRQHCQRGK